MIEIPNYELGKLAGRGGAAEVYLARHKLLDRTVAIKFFSPTHSDAAADKRFLKEAKVLAGFRQPNIVSIYDVGILEGKYYIIMEYLEGGDLKQYIKRGMSVSQSVKIIKQIASALAHAHDKGFIHRDIKSQNIMFRADGTAVLTDFGIVKDLTAETGYTLDGTSIGTPHYMSPEQALGSSKIDWRTDLYSLGVTFYEMFTGAPPYNADSAIAVALKHIKDPVPQLPEQFAGYQPIINRLMAKKPEDRFQSAHELIQALDAPEDNETPTIKFTKKLKPKRKVNPVRMFFALVVICIVSSLVYLSRPYLTEFAYFDILIVRQKPVEKPRISKSEKVKQSIKAANLLSEPEISPQMAVEIDQEIFINSELLSGAIANKDYAKALQYISQIKKEIPKSSVEMLNKADNLLELKQFYSAGDLYNTVLSVDSKNTSALLGLLYVAVEKQLGLINQKKSLIGDHEALLGLLNKAINTTGATYFKQIKVDVVESIYVSAQQQFKQKKLMRANEWTEAGLNHVPDHLRLKKLSYRIRAQISLNNNRLTLPKNDNALTYYLQILQLDPEDKRAQKGIASIINKYKIMVEAAQKNKNYKEAAQLIKRALAIAPDNKALKKTQWIISGDSATSQQESAEFFVKALKLDPDDLKTREKIEIAAKELNNKRARSEARAVLKQAIEIVPDYAPFNDLFESISRFLNARADISGLLSELSEIQDIGRKLDTYKTLFSTLESAHNQYGQKELSDLAHELKAQVKTDIGNQKNLKKIIPAEFIDLVLKHYPQLNEYVTSAQYDILVEKGDFAFSKQEMADYYIKALELNKNGLPAKDRIENLAKDLDKNGKNSEAIDILERAVGIVPDNVTFYKLIAAIKREIRIFITPSGCGAENIIIFEAPVSTEKLNICLQYRNLEPDSIVNVVLKYKKDHSPAMEIPVVLNGRSGNSPITITAPIEGFEVGDYSITVQQNEKILSETRIQFISKRR